LSRPHRILRRIDRRCDRGTPNVATDLQYAQFMVTAGGILQGAPSVNRCGSDSRGPLRAAPLARIYRASGGMRCQIYGHGATIKRSGFAQEHGQLLPSRTSCRSYPRPNSSPDWWRGSGFSNVGIGGPGIRHELLSGPTTRLLPRGSGSLAARSSRPRSTRGGESCGRQGSIRKHSDGTGVSFRLTVPCDAFLRSHGRNILALHYQASRQ
jgi:hypothetical protein